jgi:hypothetical protein
MANPGPSRCFLSGGFRLLPGGLFDTVPELLSQEFHLRPQKNVHCCAKETGKDSGRSPGYLDERGRGKWIREASSLSESLRSVRDVLALTDETGFSGERLTRDGKDRRAG